jgi:chromosome segregation ATPase
MITRLDSIDRQLSRQSSEMNEMRSEMKDMRSEMKDMRSEMKDMKEQINDVRTELKQYVHDAVDGVMAGMERLFNELRADIQRLETRIAER